MGVLDVLGKEAPIPTSHLAPSRCFTTSLVHCHETLRQPVEAGQRRVCDACLQFWISRDLGDHRHRAGPDQIAMDGLGTLLLDSVLGHLVR